MKTIFHRPITKKKSLLLRSRRNHRSYLIGVLVVPLCLLCFDPLFVFMFPFAFCALTKCTLVICPVVAVIQWVGEIDAHTAKGKARVLVFHGPKRFAAGYNFVDFDFVITTYSTIENEYWKHMMPPKEMCKYCGSKLYPNKMKTHLMYFCGPNAKQTEAQAKQVRKRRKIVGNFNLENAVLPCKKDNAGIMEKMKKKAREYTKCEEPTRATGEITSSFCAMGEDYFG